eukprot:gene14074-biopygen2317
MQVLTQQAGRVPRPVVVQHAVRVDVHDVERRHPLMLGDAPGAGGCWEMPLPLEEPAPGGCCPCPSACSTWIDWLRHINMTDRRDRGAPRALRRLPAPRPPPRRRRQGGRTAPRRRTGGGTAAATRPPSRPPHFWPPTAPAGAGGRGGRKPRGLRGWMRACNWVGGTALGSRQRASGDWSAPPESAGPGLSASIIKAPPRSPDSEPGLRLRSPTT